MTEIVGIINLTPDSFSNDGLLNARNVINRIDTLIRDGVGVIDIGAESTRPGATLLSHQQEWGRFLPVMPALKERIGKICFSIDTRHYDTANAFIEYVGQENASRIFFNDVSGGADVKLIELAKKHGYKLVLMHSLTVPADPKVTIDPKLDAVEVIHEWAKKIIAEFGKDVIVDPGIGFGKTPQQSLEIITHIARLKSLGAPLLVGHSRKSFLSLFTDKKANERDPETLLFSRYLKGQGVDYLRVHDVKSHMEMLKS